MPKTEALNSCGVKLKTKDGMVDMDAVQKIAHKQIASDAPLVKMISSNQSQEYFAVATTQGFEII
jgi:hypothetical protein